MSENIRTVTPKSASGAIKAALNKKRPVMLHGAPGIGKSDIVHQIGEQLNRPVIDIRLALYDPSDIKGFPFFDPISKSMKWAPSSELPQDPNSNAILFLDELVSATPAVQAAAYQLVLNKRIGEYRLPENVDILAAGNRASDRGVVYRMPAPLANRFTHLELRVDAEEWIEWAIQKGLHENVIGYISHMKHDLFNHDSKSASNAFPSPRTWEFTSQYLEMENEIGEESILDLISGTIGDGLAVKFNAFRKHAAKLPKAIDVLEGKAKDVGTKDVGAMYALVVSLAYELKEQHQKKSTKFWKYMDNVFDFQMKNMQEELNIMSAKLMMKTLDLPIDPSKLEKFDEYYNKYGRYIFAS